jgi:hypothetical protein
MASHTVEAGSSSRPPPSLVEQLQQRLDMSFNERCLDATHILELQAKKKQLQKDIAEQKECLAATLRSR